MSLEIDIAYITECSMNAIRNGYGLLCAADLLVLFVLSQGSRPSILRVAFLRLVKGLNPQHSP